MIGDDFQMSGVAGLFIAIVPMLGLALVGACSQPCVDRSANLIVPSSRVPAVSSITVSDGCHIAQEAKPICPSRAPGCAAYVLTAGGLPNTCVAHVEFSDGCAPIDLQLQFAKTAGCCGGACYTGDNPVTLSEVCTN